MRETPSLIGQARRTAGGRVQPIEVAVIGTGWCGALRAEAYSKHPLVEGLRRAEIRPEREKPLVHGLPLRS